MASILVTGSNGQLGHCIQDLKDEFREHHFIFTDVAELDITNEDDVNLFFKENKIDIVVNCAAYTAVDKAEEDSELCRKVNTLAPVLLGKAALKYHAQLIHVSTDYVFDGTTNIPYQEEDATHPMSVYGNTKCDAEVQLLALNKETIILRTSWLYSEYGNNFVKTITKLGNERDALNVVFDQTGTPTYAGDLAYAIMDIIDQLPNNLQGGIFHYSNEGVASWYDFAFEILTMQEIMCELKPVKSHEFKTAAHRPAYSVLDKSKIKNTYNLEIPHWKESLAICILSLMQQ